MIDIIKNNEYEILTPSGWQKFNAIVKHDKKDVIELTFDFTKLRCTVDHKIYLPNGDLVEAQQLRPNDIVDSIYGPITVLSIKMLPAEEVYDIIEVEDGNKFYANDILVSNCKFIQADETLIHPLRLANLSGVDPYLVDDGIRWYTQPQPNKTYVVGYDPSVGTGGDFAAIQVFQMPEMIQVAEWKANNIDTRGQVKTLQRILKRIQDTMVSSGQQQGDPEIYWTIENNTVGEAALQVVSDTDEENFPGTFMHEPKRAGMGRRMRKGMTTTNKSKIAAAMKFKSLVETDRITILSKALISELKGFVRSGPSFAAKYGYHDDVISATLLCIRMVVMLSNYDPDFDDKLKETLDSDDDYQAPMPIIF